MKERKKHVRAKKDRRGGGDGIPMDRGAGAVAGSDSFTVCGEFAARDLPVVFPAKDVSMFVNACVIEVELFEVADVIYDVVEKAEFEGV